MDFHDSARTWGGDGDGGARYDPVRISGISGWMRFIGDQIITGDLDCRKETSSRLSHAGGIPIESRYMDCGIEMFSPRSRIPTPEEALRVFSCSIVRIYLAKTAEWRVKRSAVSLPTRSTLSTMSVKEKELCRMRGGAGDRMTRISCEIGIRESQWRRERCHYGIYKSVCSRVD